MQLANLFFVVADLTRAKTFYDLLLDRSGQLGADSLRYDLDGLKLRFYVLSAAQAADFKLRSEVSGELPRQGLCLHSPDWGPRLHQLEQAGARWEVPWGPAPWGGFLAHLTDPQGYRWEIASPAIPRPAPANTRDDGPRAESPPD